LRARRIVDAFTGFFGVPALKLHPSSITSAVP
jgi:hypothetical protein